MFHQLYEASDVLMGKAFGVDYPAAFTHPLIEYRALTERAVIVDLTHWGALRLTGGDRVRFLNNMITGNVTTLQAGEARHAALTTIKGKLVAELFVLARADELLVLVAQGERRAVFDALDKHIIADDVELEDVSERCGVVAVEGPRCRELVWRLFPDSALPLEVLKFVDTDYQGTPVTILRGSVTGEKGLQLIVPAEGIGRIRDFLVQSGYAEDAALCGSAAWNMRRIESGIPWWGVDVEDNFPAEARLDHVVDYDKGCYLGQETLARMHFRGHPNWLLVGLRCSQLALPSFFDQKDEELTVVEEDPDAVRADIGSLLLADAIDDTALYAGSDASAGEQKPSGRLTSMTFSPRIRAAVFMGYVSAPLAEAGNEFVFSTGDEVTKTAITQLPIEESK